MQRPSFVVKTSVWMKCYDVGCVYIRAFVGSPDPCCYYHTTIMHLSFCRKPQDTGLCKDLECMICLELPDTTKASEYVFSCQQHHIICQGCLQIKIQSCPICRQDFLKAKPQRNYLAERLIRQHMEIQQKQGSNDLLEVQIQGTAQLWAFNCLKQTECRVCSYWHRVVKSLTYS